MILKDPKSVLKLIPFFAGLSAESIDRLSRQAVVRTYPAKRILNKSSWHFIIDGFVKFLTYNVEGKEIAWAILNKGEIIGELHLHTPLPRNLEEDSAITLTATTVISIPSKDFINLIHTDLEISVRLMYHLNRRWMRVRQRYLQETDATRRVLKGLLLLSYQINSNKIPFELSRELVNVTGMARETVTRTLGQLERKGLVERSGNSRRTLSIPDVSALERLVA